MSTEWVNLRAIAVVGESATELRPTSNGVVLAATGCVGGEEIFR
jgi:hypothetical protein